MEELTNFGVNLGKSYLNYEKNVELLESKLRVLTCRAADIEDEVKIVEGSGKKKRKREVENWFEDVKKVKNDFMALQNRVKEEGFWKHPFSGEHVVKMQEWAATLYEQSQYFNGFLLDAPENRGELRLTSRLFGEMFKDNLNKIWECLLIDNITSIGIYGMGGVGKTTLAKHINNHLLEINDFRVCWLTVSQELSIKKLQDDIARTMGLSLSDNDDEETRAIILSRKLMQMKNFVLILDDVWEGFCLKKLGNPLGAGCRLILTTRSLQLCRRMLCQRIFEVKTLHTNEAWELFKDMLGYQTILQADVEEIAKAVAKRCAGLPLAIITMAGSMRGVEDLYEWRNALEQLKASSIGLDDMECEVFRVLRWSFSRLSKCHQHCLLCCSLYPEDHFIAKEELISRFISLDLMDRRDTRTQEYCQGHAILNKLINVCLLEKIIDCHGVERVKMHDLIRDMVLRLTSGKFSLDLPRFMVKAGVGLTVIPSEKEWEEDLEVVSLMDNDISEISPHASPRCPKLSILIFQNNCLMFIPDSFFAFMSQLQVLDLSYTTIIELPNCISDMVNLTALILQDCAKLTFVPPLTKLKNLRELNLCKTSIENIPQGLEALVNLKYLNMICIGVELQKVPLGTFSRLCYLQCLRIRCPIQIKELQGLKQLEQFQGGLFDFDAYKQLLISRQSHGWFNYYNIFVDPESSYCAVVADRTELDCKKLTLVGCNPGNTSTGGPNVLLLPEDIQKLGLYDSNGMGSCLADAMPQLNCLKNLSEFTISGQDEVEFLLNLSTFDDQVSPCCPLRALVYLEIINLQNLVGLIRWDLEASGNLPRGTFSCLRKFCISSCHKIRKLFTLPLLQNLQNLEEVEVNRCSKLEEIVADDDAGSLGSTSSRPISATLPKLQRLYLSRLQQLRNICDGTMFCDSIEEIVVVLCPNLKRLPLFLPTVNGELSLPRTLKHIGGSSKWWGSMEWDNPSAKNVLQSAFYEREH